MLISIGDIVARFEHEDVNMELLKNIVDNYETIPRYIFKYISVYYAKLTSFCILAHIVNCTEKKCDLITRILDAHDIVLDNESIIKHIVYKDDTKCIRKSRKYWYYLYTYMIEYIYLDPKAFFKLHVNRSLSTLLIRTDVYDDKISDLLDKLSADPYNWAHILKFIKNAELYGEKCGDIIFKIRDNILQNDKMNQKDQKISDFKNRTLLGYILQSYNQIHKNISKITNNVYISDITIPKNVPIIKDKKINCIVSLTKKEIFKLTDIEYIHIAIDDIGSIDFIDATLESSKIIVKYINQNKNILVHCFKGLSRSVCFVILVLINNGMTFDEAYEHIKNRKTIIDPNPDFLDQLTKYHKK